MRGYGQFRSADGVYFELCPADVCGSRRGEDLVYVVAKVF